MMAAAPGELAQRVGVALVGIPVSIGVAYLGGYWLAGFLSILAGLAAWEFFAINRGRGVVGFPVVGSGLAVAIVLLAATIGARQADYAVWVAVLILAVGAPAVLLSQPGSKPTVAVALTVFGALYTGGLLAFAVWLRDLGDPGVGWRGTGVLFFPIALTWLGDTAAYSVGHWIGRHRLAPRLSPGKTWEGAIAGLLASAAGAILYLELTDPLVGWTITIPAAIAFGGVIAIAGQVGDLVESSFKRDCGVKDSSSLLPGHGGVLDRLDSLLFAFPIGYAYLLATGA